MEAASRDRLVAALVTLVAGVWIWAVFLDRFDNAFAEWGAALDAFHWLWAYERYHTDGAFPPGHLLTDLAFVYHAPPLWWAVIAALSHVVEPRTAGALVNVGQFFGTAAFAFLLVRSRTGYVGGVVAAVLVVHNRYFWSIAAGGFPRGFGPMFTLAVAWAWLTGRRRVVLALLVVAAGTYPSVVIPLGLAFGTWELVRFLRAEERAWRPLVELALAGLACVLLASTQSLLAPAEWGPVVTYEEAEALGAWARPGGRFPFVPMRPLYVHLANGFGLALFPHGQQLWPALSEWSFWHGHLFAYVPFGFALLFAWRRGRPVSGKLWALVGAALVGYAAARLLAFRLFLPTRQLNHVVPWVIACAFPIAWGRLLETFSLPRARRDALLALITLGTLGVLYGTGRDDPDLKPMYRDLSDEAALYEELARLPLDANIAGPITLLDPVPLLTKRQVYMNRTMINPIRAGLFRAQERRVLAQYEALYAPTLEDVVEFAEMEGVTHLALHERMFRKVEKRIPKPMKEPVRKMLKRGKKRGMALAPGELAPGLVRWMDGPWRVVEVAALQREVDGE